MNHSKPSEAAQPSPVPNSGVPVWDLVIADMKARDAMGRKKYGTPLQCGNGRDTLLDAYQECLDLAVYLRQLIEERGPWTPTRPSASVDCRHE